MSSYCETGDVYRWIPPGSVQPPVRLISNVATGTEILTLNGHGFVTGDLVTFRAEAGGSLPDPIVVGTTYYVIVLTDSTFSVTATAGGVAIDLTTEGENVVIVRQLPWTQWIAEASNEIECTLPAHAVPLDVDPVTGTYPAIVVAYTAGLVAEKALAFAGVSSVGISERLRNVRNELSAWRKGIPIRGDVVPPRTNLAIRSGATDADPRGWSSRGDGRIP